LLAPSLFARSRVWVLGELFENVGPYTILFPGCVALENTIPLALIDWQLTPLHVGSPNPVKYLDETSALFLLPCIGPRVSSQECVKFLPLMVGILIERNLSVAAYQANHNRRQRELALSGRSPGI